MCVVCIHICGHVHLVCVCGEGLSDYKDLVFWSGALIDSEASAAEWAPEELCKALSFHHSQHQGQSFRLPRRKANYPRAGWGLLLSNHDILWPSCLWKEKTRRRFWVHASTNQSGHSLPQAGTVPLGFRVILCNKGGFPLQLLFFFSIHIQIAAEIIWSIVSYALLFF